MIAFVQVIDENDRAEEERGREAVNRFFSIPFFALLGTLIPWSDWYALGAAGVLIALLLPALVWPVITLLACASVVIHGVSATPFTRLYGQARRAEHGAAGPPARRTVEVEPTG